MRSISRRLVGAALIGGGALLALAAVILAATELPTSVANVVPGSAIAIDAGNGGNGGLSGHSALHPTAYAAGATLLVAGAVAVRDRPVGPKAAIAVPAVGLGLALVGVTLGSGIIAGSEGTVGPGATAGFGTGLEAGNVLAPGDVLAIAGTAAGTAITPIVVGALREHTVVLLAGFVVAIAAVVAAPSPGLVAAVGLVGGGGAVGAAWRLDPGGWRP
ncbi:hypothetical protein [Halopenitus persicus]|uniref:Uncharacterized protein n=1 Tax=Halopenitus persicus TaxID=1048396 RepID=A0A1H3KRB2_9EURY|nr:hypothetical protein [Halopenitus persicus]SDY54205.1 hypothetical protein SAMN05216564_106106 [Halopenitus persicus]